MGMQASIVKVFPICFFRTGLRVLFILAMACMLLACGTALAGFSGQAEAAAGSAPRPAPKLMIFGDSLVAGYGLRAEDSFPAQLAAVLKDQGNAVTIINAGVSGDTTAGGRARLDWALADAPDAVILVLGGNDALRGLPPSAMRENLVAILERMTADGLPVLIAGMRAPRNMGSDYAADFDAAFSAAVATIRSRQQAALLFYPFFLEGVALEPTLNQSDGIHPNAAGVAEIVRRMLPQIQQLLELSKTS